jgi:hypothetical protein
VLVLTPEPDCLHGLTKPTVMRIDYIINALCPRITDSNDWRSVSLVFISPILFFKLSLFVIALYPESFASHGGEIYSFFLFASALNLIRVPPQALLDFSREFDITLMNNVVMALYSGSGGKDVSISSFSVFR